MSTINMTVVNDYTIIRMCASSISFIILAFFNLIINWTILRHEELRNHARFVLVFHLLFSALVYFGVCSVFYLQIYLRISTSAGACRAVITILITSASNILLTLTAMAVDRYYAICFPVKYSSSCSKQRPWLVGLLTWVLALIIPLSLLQMDGKGGGGKCDREKLHNGENLKVSLISVCFCLMLFSYAMILRESRRLGLLNRRNSVGCQTIALHGTQLAVYILPNFVSFVLNRIQKRGHLQPESKELFAVVNFAFFSLAQCVAPIVYGLRKDELLAELLHRFPCLSCHLKSLLEWTVRVAQPIHSQAGESSMTSQKSISIEPPQTPV